MSRHFPANLLESDEDFLYTLIWNHIVSPYFIEACHLNNPLGLTPDLNPTAWDELIAEGSSWGV